MSQYLLFSDVDCFAYLSLNLSVTEYKFKWNLCYHIRSSRGQSWWVSSTWQ